MQNVNNPISTQKDHRGFLNINCILKHFVVTSSPISFTAAVMVLLSLYREYGGDLGFSRAMANEFYL